MFGASPLSLFRSLLTPSRAGRCTICANYLDHRFRGAGFMEVKDECRFPIGKWCFPYQTGDCCRAVMWRLGERDSRLKHSIISWYQFYVPPFEWFLIVAGHYVAAFTADEDSLIGLTMLNFGISHRMGQYFLGNCSVSIPLTAQMVAGYFTPINDLNLCQQELC